MFPHKAHLAGYTTLAALVQTLRASRVEAVSFMPSSLVGTWTLDRTGCVDR
jgi:hypothetical protein